jgi:hypothetical protein
MNQIEVMKQALETLEECQYATTSKADKMADTAMKALRAALAEPEPTGERAAFVSELRQIAEMLDMDGVECAYKIAQAANMLEADAP